ncbi:MAG: hypothetical protein ACRCXD_18790 [Luteolibacter sp.]
MSSYWPSGLNLEDTSSPLEIIEAARQQWDARSNGMLTLIVQITQSYNKNDMMIIHAKHIPSNRTATLFSVVHRPNLPYPAIIQPKGDELPDQFKRSYYKPGIAEMSNFTGVMSGRDITNEWVCDTPTEFRSKLEKVFNLGSLKADVLSLVSGAAPVDSHDGSQAEDGPQDEEAEDANS